MRIIEKTALENMGMKSPTYGWNVEMQIKARLLNLRTKEVSVSYRPRIGESKISGTISGTVGAAIGIFKVILLMLESRNMNLDVKNAL